MRDQSHSDHRHRLGEGYWLAALLGRAFEFFDDVEAGDAFDIAQVGKGGFLYGNPSV